MSPIDLAPPAIIAPSPKLWTPSAPFIIRASEDDHSAVKAMPFLSAIAGGARRSSVGINLQFLTLLGNSADQTIYDFGNVNFPSAGLAIVASATRASVSRSTSSVSIGGSNGTLTANFGAALSTGCIAYREVSAGNNNITITYSGSTLRCGAAVWLLTDYTSATPTANASAGDHSASVSGRTVTFDLPARSRAVYFAMVNGAAVSWSSATERDEQTFEMVYSCADKSTATAITSHAESTSHSSAQSYLFGAVWN